MPIELDGGGDPASGEGLNLWIRDDLLIAGFKRQAIERMAAELQLREQAIAPASDFRSRIEGLYRNGVEWAVGVDVQTIMAHNRASEQERVGLSSMGLLDMQYLLAERKSIGGHTENRIVLTFDQQRRGFAAWLDEPAPMGSLDFISPQASLAAAFVMQEPATLVGELFETLAGVEDCFEEELGRFEREHGINIRQDVAAPLGGEFAFALDGPLAPMPSWKLIVEVYNPAQLQQTLEWGVEQLNQVAADEGIQGLELSSEQVDGRTFYRLESKDAGVAVHYVFVDGYLIAGPSRALLLSAIQTAKSGVGLTASRDFAAMLPQDGEINFSAVVYQNLGSIVGPIVRLGSLASDLSPEQQRLAEELAQQAKPSMTLAYGADDRITFVYSHEGGFISSGLASFFSFKSLLDVQQLVGHSIHQQAGYPVGSDEENVDVAVEIRANEP